MKLGIKETKDVVIAIGKFGSAGGNVLADGRVGITDIVYLYEPLTALAAAADGAAGVPGELADLDAAELEDLQATFAREFDLPADAVELVVERAVDVAVGLVELLLSFRRPPVV